METLITVLAWTLALLAAAFFVSGLDDLFIDLYYYSRWLRSRLFKSNLPATEAQLRAAPEKPTAIMIPAWDESAVIGRMLEHTRNILEYGNYHIFVGCYPNDQKTIDAVAALAKRDSRVHAVICSLEGPTSKADCLNCIVHGIRRYEDATDKTFEIFVLHDAEDVVHPFSLKLLNYHIPAAHMVQLPVVALEKPWYCLTSGSYLDEFAELHGKDMVAREGICGVVPSAGVGTGLSRAALEALARNRPQIFNVDALTEDYELGFRLHELRMKCIFVNFTVERKRLSRASLFNKTKKWRTVRELVATREYFPAEFDQAVRQKCRWVLGIVFQGWQRLGWGCSAHVRYILWRDRKTLLSSLLVVIGYAWLLLWTTAGLLLSWGIVAANDWPAILAEGSWIWYLLSANTLLMAHRLVQRGFYVGRVSGVGQAMLSIVRMVWGNLINVCAVGSATKRFFSARRRGAKLGWAKTVHVFPTQQQLADYEAA